VHMYPCHWCLEIRTSTTSTTSCKVLPDNM
jgi:hypothetical protein